MVERCPRAGRRGFPLIDLFIFINSPLTAADAQDAGGSYFEHILLCTTSVAFGHWASLVSV